MIVAWLWRTIRAFGSLFMPVISGNAVNFGFLTNDMRSLLSHSRNLLDQADKLQQLATDAQDEQLKAAMTEVSKSLISISNGIAQTVSSMSSRTASTISTVNSSTSSSGISFGSSSARGVSSTDPKKS
jgi:hypothetical protein